MATEQAAPADQPASSSKRNFILPIVILLALGAALWGFKTWNYGRSHESTDNAQVDGDIVPVLAKVGGYVTAVSVMDNQTVKTGQTLVTIDDAEYRVRVSQAEADYAAAQAAVSSGGNTGQAEAMVASATGQREASSANILAAQAANTRAQADLTRIRALADKQIVSRQQLDAAQAAADAAAAQLQGARQQTTAAGAQVSNARAGVRVAEARLQAAKAALDNAKLQLSYTHIVAPTNGMIARKQVEVGQLIAAGQPLLNVVSDSTVWITANFKETQLGDIRVGQPVVIDVDAYQCSAEGRVESLSGATGARFALLPPDNATGNFTKVVQRLPIRIAVTRPCGQNAPLRPGLSVDVHVKTN